MWNSRTGQPLIRATSQDSTTSSQGTIYNGDIRHVVYPEGAGQPNAQSHLEHITHPFQYLQAPTGSSPDIPMAALHTQPSSIHQGQVHGGYMIFNLNTPAVQASASSAPSDLVHRKGQMQTSQSNLFQHQDYPQSGLSSQQSLFSGQRRARSASQKPSPGLVQTALRKKINRIKVACNKCRAKKTKCSGHKPCLPCSHINHPCEYTPITAEENARLRERKRTSRESKKKEDAVADAAAKNHALICANAQKNGEMPTTTSADGIIPVFLRASHTDGVPATPAVDLVEVMPKANLCSARTVATTTSPADQRGPYEPTSMPKLARLSHELLGVETSQRGAAVPSPVMTEDLSPHLTNATTEHSPSSGSLFSPSGSNQPQPVAFDLQQADYRDVAQQPFTMQRSLLWGLSGPLGPLAEESPHQLYQHPGGSIQGSPFVTPLLGFAEGTRLGQRLYEAEPRSNPSALAYGEQKGSYPPGGAYFHTAFGYAQANDQNSDVEEVVARRIPSSASGPSGGMINATRDDVGPFRANDRSLSDFVLGHGEEGNEAGRRDIAQTAMGPNRPQQPQYHPYPNQRPQRASTGVKPRGNQLYDATLACHQHV